MAIPAHVGPDSCLLILAHLLHPLPEEQEVRGGGEDKPSVEDVHIIHRPQTGLILGRPNNLPGQRYVTVMYISLTLSVWSPLYILESADV